MIGSTISHYTILEKLGQGGMGVVYKAEDTRLKRTVALKFLPPGSVEGEEARARFIHEAQAASALEHPNICNIHEIDETRDGQLFIVMAYYEGQSLRERIGSGPLKLDEAADLAVQIAEGLLEAHGRGIVHRDIKAANIIVTNKGQAKILDFGLAKLSGRTRLTKTGTSTGTVAYMSPEQAAGKETDQRTDIWSLGILFYEMIAGRLPFKGDYEQAVLYSILNEDPEPLSALRTGVPLELERIVNKALAKDPDERYQHADDLIADLKHFQRKSGVTARPNGPDVQRSGAGMMEKTGVTESGEISQKEGIAAKTGSVEKSGAAQKPSFSKKWMIPAAVLVVAALSVSAYFLLKNRLPREPIPVAVISFENQTGSTVYDYLAKAIPNLLITSLEQSKFLRVTTWERMRDILRQMGKEVQTIDAELGIELCRREGVGRIVTGSFTRAGGAFATDIKVLDVESKRILASARASGPGEESILRNQIDDLSREIVKGIGLSAALDKDKPAPRFADISTSSMEAYSYFLLGRERYDFLEEFEAIRLLIKAVEYDSSFAIAYLYLSRAYGDIANVNRQKAMCRKAFALSSRAPEKERMMIEAYHASIIEGNTEKQISVMENLCRRFPDEKQARFELGALYVRRGRIDDADRELKEVLRLDPDHGASLNQLGYNTFRRGRFREALSYLSRYAALFPDEPNPYDSMGDCYFDMGEIDSALFMYREAVRRNPGFYASVVKPGIIFALLERYEEAEAVIRGILGSIESLGGLRGYIGLLYNMQGRYSEAHEIGGEAGRIWTGYEADLNLALLEAAIGWRALECGELDEIPRIEATAAQRIETMARANFRIFWAMWALIMGERDILLKNFDSTHEQLAALEDTLANISGWNRGMLEYEKKRLLGSLFLAEGKPDSVIAVLGGASLPGQPELWGANIARYNLSSYYASHADILARAYIAKGDLRSAAREYERITRFDPKHQDRRFIHPRLHFRLGKVYEDLGEKEKAAAEYEKFLRLWSKAEANRQELVEAAGRMEKLKKE